MPRKSAVTKNSVAVSKNNKDKPTRRNKASGKKDSKNATVNKDSKKIVEDPPVEVVEKKRRVQPTRESVLEELDAIIMTIDKEITNKRESETKVKGIKFLRSLRKSIKTSRSHSARVMKTKNRVPRKNNKNSGFRKPVEVSKEMANFAGWNHGELHSRVDVTKFLCDYIKEHDLQNPEDRRQIKPDKKLQTLLRYDPKKSDNPLTYFRLQSLMKPHFPSKSS